MGRPDLFIVHRLEALPAPISYSQKLVDHQAILQGFLDTHITRNHSAVTIENECWFYEGWFKGCSVKDDTHPDGERQLFLWEAMEPRYGRQRIVEYSKGLREMGLSPLTVSTYMGRLRRLFQYVLEYPYIPNSEVQSVVAKYGRIEQPVLEYDYPLHVLDHEDEGFVLTGKRLHEFYEFVRLKYITHNQKKFTASRNYTMIVVAGESGLRASEIQHLDAFGPHRDLFYEQNRIQTRFGKGVKGSGKRVRKTIFTPYAQATLRIYEERIRPSFPDAKINPALFLTESGSRLSYDAMSYFLSCIVKEARLEGLDLPPKLTWHSLRKSFATNFIEQYPDKVWVLMEMMGHLNPSTLYRYVKHNRSYYDQAIDNMVSDLIPKNI